MTKYESPMVADMSVEHQAVIVVASAAAAKVGTAVASKVIGK